MNKIAEVQHKVVPFVLVVGDEAPQEQRKNESQIEGSLVFVR